MTMEETVYNVLFKN